MTRQIDINEAPDGWTIGRRHYPNATAALSAVKRSAKRLARKHRGEPVVDVITWHPATDAGNTIVRVLGGREA